MGSPVTVGIKVEVLVTVDVALTALVKVDVVVVSA
jgi:hypothetical protein